MFQYVLLYVPTILALLAGVVWAIRLEGKVTNHDNLFIEREKQSNERLQTALTRHEELKIDVKEHLKRIESKLDSIAYNAVFSKPA